MNKITKDIQRRYRLRRAGNAGGTGVVERVVNGQPTGRVVLELAWRGGESPGWTKKGWSVRFDDWREAVAYWEAQERRTDSLTGVLREHLSPHAVALIAAKCQPCYGKGEAGQSAEREVTWFTEMLIEMVGTSEYERLCEELGV